MNFSCSQCSFTAQFESALLMHHQLHHETEGAYPLNEPPMQVLKEPCTVSRMNISSPTFGEKKNKLLSLPSRSASATKLFGKLKAKICRSKTMYIHPEESRACVGDLGVPSECTSKAMKMDSPMSRTSALMAYPDSKETFRCHLCNFDADRITVLDRHLLNDHKIGLDNLLKLVMAKTQDGLSEDGGPSARGIRQPYYKPQDEMLEEGEFIIETVVPKVKILKHTSTNTEVNLIRNRNFLDDRLDDDLEDNWKVLSSELETMMKNSPDVAGDDVMAKMKTLNKCMCKIVDSSNMLKKVLNSKNVKDLKPEGLFNLGLGDRETPRNWARAHSEQMDRSRNKYFDNNNSSRGEKGKMSSDSFYF